MARTLRGLERDGIVTRTILATSPPFFEKRTSSWIRRPGANWETRMLSILRIMVGVLYMEHGLAKILGFPEPYAPMPCSP